MNSIRHAIPAWEEEIEESREIAGGMGFAIFRGRRIETEHCPMFVMLTLFASVVFGGVSAVAAPAQMIPIAYTAPDRAAVDSIHAGNHDCPHCMLAGANLDNTCVKNGNLEGADFSNVHAVLMCMSYANFTGVSFRDANLSGANLAHANLTNADFTGATLAITSFKGTDLTKTKGLTQAQLDTACSDKDTKVPAGLKAHICT